MAYLVTEAVLTSAELLEVFLQPRLAETRGAKSMRSYGGLWDDVYRAQSASICHRLYADIPS